MLPGFSRGVGSSGINSPLQTLSARKVSVVYIDHLQGKGKLAIIAMHWEVHGRLRGYG